MTSRLAVVVGERIARYGFGEGHPFGPDRHGAFLREFEQRGLDQRALMLEPRMLLLDEPLAGVNRTLGRSLLEHIERLRAERGVTILLVEHDMDVVMRHSDTVVVMGEGRVLTIGAPEEVRNDPRVVEAYLGAHADREGADE